MQLHVNHTTRYNYDQPVDYALQKVRLHPLPSPLQDISDWEMVVEGGKIEASYLDHYGNHTDLVSIEPGAQVLTISAAGTVTTRDTAGVLGKVYGCAPLWHFAQATALTSPGDRVQALAKVLGQSDSDLAGLHALSAAVLQATPYQTGETNTDTTAEEALKIGHGVCQDHAHIFVAAARDAGIPARYVSGYLMINDQIDQDASHAWAEAHLDDLGWVGFDVSNGVAPDEKYVRIAIGRDARDAAPISGMRIGVSDEAMIVTLQVQQ
ncbi:transglutaminase family protein [Sedimentitalea todarodis]|uniref:Transglutaminase family protein n=1 Tax=Sedimentitalea todarodis TaxID=1631240 RepID=A0ABU3VE55_9RHOB|nr:transglutaminase family protein [Sedimentitalea todarodis]MDU9004436.1 transglutaminase family protein [Sedimentitalea todarodis]